MRHYLTLSLLLVALVTVKPAFAAEEAEKARMVCDRTNTYPSKLLAQSREGWVDLRFTMKADGSLSDIEVVNVFGDPAFGKAAQEALASCRYEQPEQIAPKGTEVNNLRKRYFFAEEPFDKGSTRKVHEQLDEAYKRLKNGDITGSENILAQAEKDSKYIYEYNHLIILRAELASARNDDGLALLYINSVARNRNQIKPREYDQLLRLMLKLEIKEGRFVSAERIVQEITQGEPLEVDKTLLAQFAALKDVVTAGQPLSIDGQIPLNCHPAFCEPGKTNWFYTPYNRTVSLADIQGELSKVLFRCDRKTMIFEAQAGITWTIPKSWGQCTVYVLGNPGTRFKLIDETL
ncbi:TonB family protein [Niveispirillum sp. BGYR6]|uniref:energy transducer TonB n=1 Tax=Niveispirillum sp. BGYR6 TaxID=2971249 RepID=UPI0022B94DC5|nr:TonB family protein [Niveispirillum sp. BGYR6]MDG5497733.1 TonB family protein [Niveispirillum sp. BGYR6]